MYIGLSSIVPSLFPFSYWLDNDVEQRRNVVDFYSFLTLAFNLICHEIVSQMSSYTQGKIDIVFMIDNHKSHAQLVV